MLLVLCRNETIAECVAVEMIVSVSFESSGCCVEIKRIVFCVVLL